MSGLFIGLMSGTSLDGVDGVLADLSNPQQPVWLSHAFAPFDAGLRQRFLALHQTSPDELDLSQRAGLALAHLYAQVVQNLLSHKGLKPTDIEAIGAHGQTVRHRPTIEGGVGYTLQINQPALLVELTGIRVVADFRSRDIAAGGQGAPLVPAFHQALWGDPARPIAALNLGGIANLSLMAPGQPLLGFDCGPGNMLMDAWHQLQRGAPYDAGGAWAASGQPHPALLADLLAEPFFALSAPKSTGRDLFHLDWLHAHVQRHPGVSAVDVQATLLELTAQTSVQALRRYMPAPAQWVVCGGGAFNTALMQRLAQLAPCPVVSSADKGLHPSHVEAAAFAWLAQRALSGLSGNAPSVTGARGERVLGAIYPA